MTPGQKRGIAAAIIAAVTFALTVPVAKSLVVGASPWLVAGLLYLGSGIGLAALSALRAPAWSLPGRDWARLATAIVAGGILAPVLLLAGLRSVSGSTAALLLTCESVFTSLLAWIVFREHVDRRILLGFVAIVAGGLVLAAAHGGTQEAPLAGVALVLGACLAWGIDNNVTRTISLRDPLQIAAAKGLVAGTTNTLLAVLTGAQWPTTTLLLVAGLSGFVGYGLSLALFIYALRELGTARTSAYFSTAPFVAAVMSVVFLREPVTGGLLIAGALMSLGVWLHVTESHSHEHRHETFEHEHAHEHDEHHDHHDDGAPPGSHTHRHRHVAMTHRHPHFPDAHHRHGH